MQGIEVINTMTFHKPCLIVIILINAAAILTVVGHFKYSNKESRKTSIWLFAIALIMGIIVMINEQIPFLSKQYNQYEVTVDDNVKFNEFMNKYSIIKVNGNIYTITEKENTDNTLKLHY